MLQAHAEGGRNSTADGIVDPDFQPPSGLGQDPGVDTERWENIFGRSLYYFNLYRMLLGAGLMTISLSGANIAQFGSRSPQLFLYVSIALLLISAANLVTITKGRIAYRHQAQLQLSTDILIIGLLMYASGGMGSGLELLLIVSVASGGVVLSGRMTLFFAALATVMVFAVHTVSLLLGQEARSGYPQIGLLGIGLYATGLAIYILAYRIRSTEALAESRAVDLANLGQINELVVQQLKDGVVVVDADLNIRLANEAARGWLKLGPDQQGNNLETASSQLARLVKGARTEIQPGMKDMIQIKGGPLLLPHTIPLSRSQRAGAMILLTDTSEVQRQAQQFKLAAMGRLSAAIAHEIRNPLGAVSHAGQLLDEATELSSDSKRLVRIIQDQSDRIDNIVRAVLKLGGQTPQPVKIFLDEWLPDFVEKFAAVEGVSTDRLRYDGGSQFVCFDVDQLFQVVTNLCENALRYSPRDAEIQTVDLMASSNSSSGRVVLDVIDYGSGVPEELQDQVFEPFFTTQTSGTGLGLYVARAFCETNNAELVYLNTDDGRSRFRIQFGDLETCDQETGT